MACARFRVLLDDAKIQEQVLCRIPRSLFSFSTCLETPDMYRATTQCENKIEPSHRTPSPHNLSFLQIRIVALNPCNIERYTQLVSQASKFVNTSFSITYQEPRFLGQKN